VDPDERQRQPRSVVVYADKKFETEVDRPERHGRYCFWPVASLCNVRGALDARTRYAFSRARQRCGSLLRHR
jgi:hypothetical protein